MSGLSNRCRRFALLFATGALAIMSACAGAQSTVNTALAFEVLRNGKPLGSHEIRVRREDDALVAEIDIKLAVKIAFITVFRYEHRNREVWRDGRLASITTQTRRNGETLNVSGRATPNGFEITDANGLTTTLDANVLPSSYWRPETQTAEALLNTQTGELINISVEKGETQDALHRYDLSGDLDLSLWYDDSGCLARIQFEAPKDGSQIDYRQQAIADSGTGQTTCPAEIIQSRSSAES